ncbi:hypothetical protein BGZ98_009110 [Dissophora globulifera]|nr:hypothetical protein BGZ98_009110 [Dissophora globulifera]
MPLPPEILDRIGSFIDLGSLPAACLVCKYWLSCLRLSLWRSIDLNGVHIPDYQFAQQFAQNYDLIRHVTFSVPCDEPVASKLLNVDEDSIEDEDEDIDHIRSKRFKQNPDSKAGPLHKTLQDCLRLESLNITYLEFMREMGYFDEKPIGLGETRAGAFANAVDIIISNNLLTLRELRFSGLIEQAGERVFDLIKQMPLLDSLYLREWDSMSARGLHELLLACSSRLKTLSLEMNELPQDLWELQSWRNRWDLRRGETDEADEDLLDDPDLTTINSLILDKSSLGLRSVLALASVMPELTELSLRDTSGIGISGAEDDIDDAFYHDDFPGGGDFHDDDVTSDDDDPDEDHDDSENEDDDDAGGWGANPLHGTDPVILNMVLGNIENVLYNAFMGGSSTTRRPRAAQPSVTTQRQQPPTSIPNSNATGTTSSVQIQQGATGSPVHGVGGGGSGSISTRGLDAGHETDSVATEDDSADDDLLEDDVDDDDNDDDEDEDDDEDDADSYEEDDHWDDDGRYEIRFGGGPDKHAMNEYFEHHGLKNSIGSHSPGGGLNTGSEGLDEAFFSLVCVLWGPQGGPNTSTTRPLFSGPKHVPSPGLKSLAAEDVCAFRPGFFNVVSLHCGATLTSLNLSMKRRVYLEERQHSYESEVKQKLYFNSIIDILTTCSGLELLHVEPYPIDARSIVSRKEEWVCTRLKSLRICIEFDKTPPPLKQEDGQKVVETDRQIQIETCQRLGRLTCLEELMLQGGNPPCNAGSDLQRLSHPNLQRLNHYRGARLHLALSLESGLEELAGLEKLQRLNLLDLGVHSLRKDNEIQWLGTHWPALRQVDGFWDADALRLRICSILSELGPKVNSVPTLTPRRTAPHQHERVQRRGIRLYPDLELNKDPGVRRLCELRDRFVSLDERLVDNLLHDNGLETVAVLEKEGSEMMHKPGGGAMTDEERSARMFSWRVKYIDHGNGYAGWGPAIGGRFNHELMSDVMRPRAGRSPSPLGTWF